MIEAFKALLGEKNFVATAWTWLGGIAGLFCIALLVTKTQGLEPVGGLFQFLGLPDGAMTGVDSVEAWIIERKNVITLIADVLIALALLALFAGSQRRSTVPSGPAAATFWIAMMFSQIVGGPNFLVIVPAVIVVGAFWWFGTDKHSLGWSDLFERLAISFIELCTQAIFVPLITALALLFPVEKS